MPSHDDLTTASINSPDRRAPTPMADVGNGGGYGYGSQQVAQGGYSNGGQSLNQPYPAQPTSMSSARMSSQPASIQRSELAPPSGSQATSAPISSPTDRNREVALAQPMPAAQPARQSGQLTVPEPAREPLVTGSNPSRVAAQPTSVPAPTHKPVPEKAPEKVALLPQNAAGRVKPQASATPEPAGDDPGTYTVKPGDSLAKIARQTGASVDDLKTANNLSGANIRVGQKLQIPAGRSAPAKAADAVQTASVPANQMPKAEPAALKPAPKASEPVTASAPSESVNQVASADPQASAPQGTGIGKYRWPATGAVIAKYGQNVNGKRNDGIDISVPEGTPIKAAENGVVIYAGNGLKELGNTVLVRHADGAVTVYGNADSLSVQRGQKVQRGQQIAKSGMSGSAQRPQLHFEVRKDASPVDPMTFLE